MIYDVFNVDTGEIYGNVNTPEVIEEADHRLNESGTAADYRTQYVNIQTGALAVRPTFSGVFDKTAIAANGVASCTISGLPNPTRVTVTPVVNTGVAVPAPFSVTDGSFKFATRVPGSYVVVISSFPYAAKTFTIVAS